MVSGIFNFIVYILYLAHTAAGTNCLAGPMDAALDSLGLGNARSEMRKPVDNFNGKAETKKTELLSWQLLLCTLAFY